MMPARRRVRDAPQDYLGFLCWNAVGERPVAVLNIAQKALSVA
jgi:hypothetical protein